MKVITSTQNSFVKELIFLNEKSRNRKKTGHFLIEGLREIRLALAGNYEIETIFFNKNIISEKDFFSIISTKNENIEIIEISSEVYEKLSYRSSTEGILALAKSKNHSLENIIFKKENPLILVAEAPEKPGNIGALLRTADAAGLDAVIIANPKTDLYNPNIIRSSVGCIFTIPIGIGSTSEIINFLKNNNFNVFCAALSASVEYQTISYIQRSAIVVGTEDTGLSKEWLKNSTQNIIIPMSGVIDSMNVSVAAAIITFEAKRQRGFS
ncbi:MAG: RNA methyltransferase [Capnocytophaga sp.]|nr:RNA methyltransferase [Capnocytophaga sp.]